MLRSKVKRCQMLVHISSTLGEKLTLLETLSPSFSPITTASFRVLAYNMRSLIDEFDGHV